MTIAVDWDVKHQTKPTHYSEVYLYSDKMRILLLTLLCITDLAQPVMGRQRREFNCRFCPKTFSKPANLRQHEIIHTGEKPYKCDICGKAFNRKGNMIAHKVIHVNVFI